MSFFIYVVIVPTILKIWHLLAVINLPLLWIAWADFLEKFQKSSFSDNYVRNSSQYGFIFKAFFF